MEILETLKAEFNNHVSFRSKRPGIVQVLAPLFHEDGDMLDIFIDLPADPSKPIRISDHGLTLMRLSYSYELDTPTKQKVFTKIITENGVSEDRGRLYIETKPEGVYPALLQFAQTVAKVSNLQVFASVRNPITSRYRNGMISKWTGFSMCLLAQFSCTA